MADDSSRMTEKVKLPQPVATALKASGFPFQTAVAHAIAATPGWVVHASEYPWQTSRGESRFLDLVATNRTLYLTIECKKTRKETLTFLRPLSPGPTTGLVQDFRCLRAFNVNDSTRRIEIICENWALHPRSNVSEFCVVGTSATGDQRLLERDAELLIRATDAFAFDLKRLESEPQPYACLIVPVVVTNAKLYTARYNPNTVSFDTGEFTAIPDDVTNPECVRFHKAFTSDAVLFDLGDRTIFVVNAESLTEFLSRIAPGPMQPTTERAGVMLTPRSEDIRRLLKPGKFPT
jgi:hypothetical protein